MAYNSEYPYTDATRYNSDWALNKIKDLQAQLDSIGDDIFNRSKEYTDDTELWDEFISRQKGENKVKIVIGDPENKKITYQNDLSLLKN